MVVLVCTSPCQSPGATGAVPSQGLTQVTNQRDGQETWPNAGTKRRLTGGYEMGGRFGLSFRKPGWLLRSTR